MTAVRRSEVFVMIKTHLAFATSKLFSRAGFENNQGLFSLILFVTLSISHFVIKMIVQNDSAGP